jgi:flavin-dependent dehydrogenase
MDRQASTFEARPLRAAAESYDVAILGGGLAGLTLAIQLKRLRPQTSIVVLEKREGPAPDAAFKVGESTVPSGSHYFAEVVGMRDHLEAVHQRKCGLRYWLTAGGNKDITRRFETGPPAFTPHVDYQIDRGRFENELASRALALGVDLLQGCRVGEVTLTEDGHTVAFTQMDAETKTSARWVVDAAGRASLLKNKLGLSREVDHTINSSWLRLAGGLDLEQWGADDAAFMGRMSEPGIRQYSTNHLMGQGYWVWMIPLGTGPISIGVCADPRFHPFEELNELDRMIGWLCEHEPQLGQAIDSRRGDIQDFLRVEDFAYGVERVLSPERWSLAGEAGAFADPFYSPGSDFIAYSNSFTADVIARDLDGEDVGERIEYFNDLYLRTFAMVLSRTENLYEAFGNPRVIEAKLSYDAVVNHGGVVLVAVKEKLTDLELMKSVDADIDRIYRLNMRTQRLFREWNELEPGPADAPAGVAGLIMALIHGILALVQDHTDDELRVKVADNARAAEAMAVAIFHKAAAGLDEPPDPERPVNPYAITLRRDAWEAEGLFDEPGWTLADANAAIEGIENFWLPEAPA